VLRLLLLSLVVVFSWSLLVSDHWTRRRKRRQQKMMMMMMMMMIGNLRVKDLTTTISPTSQKRARSESANATKETTHST